MSVLRILIAAVVLQAAPPQTPSALIEGRVLGPGGNPLSKVTVTLQGINAATQRAAAQTIISSGDGSFSFDKLLPGIYRLTAVRTGFTKSEFGQKGPNGPGTPITVSRDQKLRSIVLTIAQLGAISGHIHDRDGLPVVGAIVQALKNSNPGPLQGQTAFAVQSVTTDDKGEFRLFWLPPGSYVIGTSLSSSVTVTMASAQRGTVFTTLPLVGSNRGTPIRKPRTDGSFEEEIEVPSYYPGTITYGTATRVPVRAGETISGIDFTISFAPSHRIRGEIAPPPSSPIPFIIQLIPRKSPGGPMTNTRIQETGAFEISGIVAGEYLLNGVPIVVGDSDVDNLRLGPLAELISVEGKVTLDGAVDGEPGRNIVNRLIFVPLTYNSPPPFFLPPDVNGSFRANLAVGDYLLLMDGDPANNDRYLKSARFGNQDGLDVIHISGKPQSVLEIVVGSAKGSVDAQILDDRHEPALNATIVLIPNPPRRHRTDLYLTATPDAMGRFHFNAAPGDYKVFAWEDIESGAWMDADFMVKQESRGQPVTIREGSRDAVDVTVIPYVP